MRTWLRWAGTGAAALTAALACDSSFNVDPDAFDLIPRFDALDFDRHRAR
jgi:hypothetical protein